MTKDHVSCSIPSTFHSHAMRMRPSAGSLLSFSIHSSPSSLGFDCLLPWRGMEKEESKNLTFSLPSADLQRLPHLKDFNPTIQSHTTPLDYNPFYHPTQGFYITSSDVIIRHTLHDLSGNFPSKVPYRAYHRAGPRKEIFFHPSQVHAAIVTCGGLCPGMNTVIRELVVGLRRLYGVQRISGVLSGYRGFYSSEPMPLDPKLVNNWHKIGGTAIETSRGGFDLKKIVDAIEARGFNQVYIIGGDGTMRGAAKIFNEICRRKLTIAVTGIPKTVDNDVGIIDRSFGFQTAVEMAQQPINAAHVEAESAVNGIGLVKLMGRSTGHIALHATLSSRDVDCCLIPENDFYLEGEGGLFEFIGKCLKDQGHAVIVAAEGAGQELIPRTDAQKEEGDESGNPVLLDVGAWLKSELKRWWARDHPGELLTVKYIDPTYMIRAVPANATDNLYCTMLAHSAIHGVMAGHTGFVSGPVNGNYAYIPLEEVAEARSVVDTGDHKWAWVRSITNQPDFQRMKNIIGGH
ncbi:phosphofructokinase beta-subunit [Asimina triloba]